jgi:hypothetical protein
MNNNSNGLDAFFSRARNTPPLRSSEEIKAIVHGSHITTTTGLTVTTLSHPMIVATVAGVAITAAIFFIGRSSSSVSPTIQSSATAPSTVQIQPSVLQTANIPAAHAQPHASMPVKHPLAYMTDNSKDLHSQSPVASHETWPEVIPNKDETSISTDIIQYSQPTVHTATKFGSLPATMIDAGKDTDVYPQRGITYILEGGTVYTIMRGGLRNVFNPLDNTAQQNFTTSSGNWGLDIALGMEMPVFSWIDASLVARLTRFTSTYNATTYVPVQIRNSSGQLGTDIAQFQHTAALTLGELSLEPSVRVKLQGFPVFTDLGLSVGYLVQQSGNYTESISSLPTGVMVYIPSVSAPITLSKIGQPKIQLDVLLGIGAEIPLSRTLLLDAGVHGRYAFMPFFSDNYPSVLSFSPIIGLRYALPE